MIEMTFGQSSARRQVYYPEPKREQRRLTDRILAEVDEGGGGTCREISIRLGVTGKIVAATLSNLCKRGALIKRALTREDVKEVFLYFYDLPDEAPVRKPMTKPVRAECVAGPVYARQFKW